MKYLFALLLFLSAPVFAQSNSKAPHSTVAPAKAVLAAAKVSPPPIATAQMSELDYYKKMYEQAKADADRAHNDIMAAYAVNTGIIGTIAAAILALQFFNVKSELKKSKKLTSNSVSAMNAALANLRKEFAELQTTILERLSQETINRTEQIKINLSDLGNKYGSRITYLEIKNQSKKFNEYPWHRASASHEEVTKIMADTEELSQLIRQVADKLDSQEIPLTTDVNAIGNKVISMQEITFESFETLKNLAQRISSVSEDFSRKLTLLSASVALFSLDKHLGQKKYGRVYKPDPAYWQFEDIQSLFA